MTLISWLSILAEGLEPLDRLAVRTAHPRWIVDAYADLLPPEEVESALRANNVDAPVTLAVRPGLAEVAELLAAGAVPCRHSPFAARWTGNPADLPAVREGRAGVQDEGSQLVAMALAAADAPRGRWLDLCAGPGGKTALLAGLAEATNSVLAVDVAPHRAALVRRAVRAYPDPPAVVVADGTRPAWPPGSFARVLADVPCTGLGALRRRPESRWRRQAGEVEELHGLQLALLASAIDSARPGGVIGYVTCSPHRRETVDVVTETLASRDDIEVIPAARLLPESLDATTVGGAARGGPRGSALLLTTATSPSCGRTGTARTRCSRRTCAATRWVPCRLSVLMALISRVRCLPWRSSRRSGALVADAGVAALPVTAPSTSMTRWVARVV